MKTTKILTAALVLTTALLLSACTNVEKLVDSGNYEQAIAYSVKKLRGKNKKKQKHVLALEKAFNKANQRDVRRMEVLKKRGSSEDWEEVYQLVQNIDRRQRLVEPLLPVIDREGYRAEFKFVKVANLENESRNQLAVTLYLDVQLLLTISQRVRPRGLPPAQQNRALPERLPRYGLPARSGAPDRDDSDPLQNGQFRQSGSVAPPVSGGSLGLRSG